VDFAKAITRFLNYFGRWRERDELDREVQKVSDQLSVNSEGKITKSQYLLESGRGQRLLQQGRAGQAEQVFRALLARLEGPAAYDTRYDQTLVLGYLGRCLRAQGHPIEAADLYRCALSLAEGLEQTESVRNQIGFYHADLADALAGLGQYAEARANYEKSLAIAQQNGNDRSAGVALGQLGTLALQQGDLKDARQRYLEALALFQRMDEDQSQAAIWHQLGRVAQEARDWDEAERCYKQSLSIKENLGDWALAATSCNQLAIVAQNAGRPQEAERWYLMTIELDEKVGSNPKDIAIDYNNLTGLYLTQNRLEQAEELAHRALAILETLDLSAQPWKTYNILAEIAEKRGRPEESRDWRRKRQESRLMFESSSQADTNSPGVRQNADQWNDMVAGVVKACLSGQPDSGLGKFLDEMSGEDEWKNLVAVLPPNPERGTRHGTVRWLG
jgi:tetratricopeptide (TPR) repeat protein